MALKVTCLKRVMIWAGMLCLLITGTYVSGQDTDADKERLCRQNLGILGDAIFLYLRRHSGRLPGKLSDLYTDGLVMDLTVFSCPASGNKITDAGRIDSLTDYILVPNDSGEKKALLLKDKDNFHNGNAHFFFSNWEVKKMPVNSPPGPAPEIPAEYLRNPRRDPAEIKPSDPARPSAKTTPATTSSPSQPNRQTSPSGPVYSGGGGAGVTSGPPVPVIILGFAIVFMVTAIVLVLRRKTSMSVTAAGRGPARSGDRTKIELKIQITEPDGTVRNEVFFSAPVRVGRSPANDLVLEDPSVSREHARITAEGGKFYLVDLSRGDRTLLDNNHVTRAQIYVNSRIILGSTEIRIT